MRIYTDLYEDIEIVHEAGIPLAIRKIANGESKIILGNATHRKFANLANFGCVTI